jgi:hypothetical protein
VDRETGWADLPRASFQVNMDANGSLRESVAMSDEPEDLAEVQRQLEAIQRRKRDDVRWSMSRHTAERAIEAITPPDTAPEQGGAGKRRRRKRHKRLL